MPSWYIAGNERFRGPVVAGGSLLIPSAPTNFIHVNATSSGGTDATTADVPAGSLVVFYLAAWNGSNGTAISVTDNAGNTYTLATQAPAVAGINYPAAIFYCSNCLHIPVGALITANLSAADACIKSGFYIANANGGPDTATYNSGSSTGATSISLSTGTLGLASEIIFGGLSTTSSFSSLVNSAGFTELINTSGGGPFDNDCALAYTIVSSTSPVTYNPTFASQHFAAVLAGFKAG